MAELPGTYAMTPSTLGTIVVLTGATGLGLNPLFARWMYSEGLTPETAVFYKTLVPALAYLPFVASSRKHPRLALVTAGLGGLMGLGTMAYMVALSRLPVATVALVYFTYPMFTIIFGWIFFKERLTRRGVATALLVLLACALILSPGQFSADQFEVLLLTFLTPTSFAFLLLGFQHWVEPLPLTSRLGVSVWAQAVVIMVWFLAVSTDVQFLPSTSRGWIAAGGLALVSSLLPQVTMTAGVQLLGAGRTSILGTTELVVALTVGWVILAEPARPAEALGALLLLTAIMLGQPGIEKLWQNMKRKWRQSPL